MSVEQQELFRAPSEENRPKAEIPVKATVKERTSAPPEPPKKRTRVKGHRNGATYLMPRGCGGRVMLLDRIVLGVRFEDPFGDRGQYPIEMDFDEFASGEWGSADPEHVVSEYDRLAIIPPENDIEARCESVYLLNDYKTLLKAAQAKIETELKRIYTTEFLPV